MKNKSKKTKAHRDLFVPKNTCTAMPPGTIVYTGSYTEVPLEIELYVYNQESLKVKTLKEINGDFDPDKIYWFNIIGLNDEAFIKKVGDLFGIHPMELEDIVHVSQWSKIEAKENYVFSIFKMIYQKAPSSEWIHEHVSIFWKDNIVLTFQETKGDAFDGIRQRLTEGTDRIRTRGARFLYYALIDALIDPYFQLLHHISSRFIDLEIRILDENFKGKEELYHLRKELLYFINSVAPIKEAIQGFIKNENAIVSGTIAPFYKDLQDHLNQIHDALKSYRELTNSLNEIQLANTSNEMNKSMMTLTIFSAIFIPLSFLAGVFGMNFKYFPGLDSPYGFYGFWGLCVLVTGILLIYFKKKKID